MINGRFIKAENGCWNWTGSVSATGYGKYRLNKKTVAAHRMAWLEAHGDVPSGFLVCHACDNPRCVNPSHLFLGRHVDNSRDMVKKGRSMGVRRTKLNADDVLAIRAASNADIQQLAQKYEVTKTTIRNVRKGVLWKCVPISLSSTKLP